MMQAQTLTNVILTKDITINVQGLTVQLLSEFQSGRREFTLVKQTVNRVAERATDINKETTDIKNAQSQQLAKLDAHGMKLDVMDQKLDVIIKSVAGNPRKEGQETRASVSEEFKFWKKLEAALGVEGVGEAVKALDERLRIDRVPGTADWILQDSSVQRWYQGEVPFVVISGDTCNGKTFLASRFARGYRIYRARLKQRCFWSLNGWRVNWMDITAKTFM